MAPVRYWELTYEGTVRSVEVTAPGGKESSVFLDNAYSEYRRDPTLKADVIERYIGGLTETFAEHAVIDVARIVPVIKDRGWRCSLRRSRRRAIRAFSGSGDFKPGIRLVRQGFLNGTECRFSAQALVRHPSGKPDHAGAAFRIQP